MSTDVEFALGRVPDVPAWVDTRGMLLSGDARVWRDGDSQAFVVTLAARALASVVGRVRASILAGALESLEQSAAGTANVLCQETDAGHVARCLPDWRAQTAVLHTLAHPDADPSPGTTIFNRESAPPFDHLPATLREEILQALAGRPVTRFVGPARSAAVPSARPGLAVAAAWADGLPVAFCYAVVETETLWDVSIDTVDPYRRRGLGALAARAMIAFMARRGKSPVWGALASNEPSMRLAARLGFVPHSRLVVLAPTTTSA